MCIRGHIGILETEEEIECRARMLGTPAFSIYCFDLAARFWK